MKKVLYILGGLLLLLIVVAVAGIIYLNVAYPKVSPAEDIWSGMSPRAWIATVKRIIITMLRRSFPAPREWVDNHFRGLGVFTFPISHRRP